VVPVLLALTIFGVGLVIAENHSPIRVLAADTSPWEQNMDAFCAAKLNEKLPGLSADDRKRQTDTTFFSWKLHTCVQVETIQDPKDPGAMDYIVSDLTYGFIAPPKWHRSERPLHVYQSDIRSYHRLYAEGYWAPVSSDPGQQLVAEANAVKLDCDYSEANGPGSDSNTCTETDGYTQFGSIHADTQTYHVVSWSGDEVIATDVERGLSGSTTTTLIIHPTANEVEVFDSTRMDDKQPELTKGMSGKSFRDHHELHGGMYLLDTQGVLFQCDQDGAVVDMRLDIVDKHHGDVVDVPPVEWNAGAKATHKFNVQECSAALQRKLVELR
jgi:hypothetical protein